MMDTLVPYMDDISEPPIEKPKVFMAKEII